MPINYVDPRKHTLTIGGMNQLEEGPPPVELRAGVPERDLKPEDIHLEMGVPTEQDASDSVSRPAELPVGSHAQRSVRGFLNGEFSGFAVHGELVHDSQDSDTVHEAMKARFNAYDQADALNWLLEGSEPIKAQPQPQEDQGFSPASALQTAVTGTAEVTSGLPLVGGVRDAVQSLIDLGTHIDNYLNTGGVQLLDERGNFSPKFVGPGELARLYDPLAELPDPEILKPKTAAGKVERVIGQFLRPF